MTSALILGVDSAAGAYLARLLLARGYVVAGSAATARPPNLAALEILDQVALVDGEDGADEVYDLQDGNHHLAGPRAKLFTVDSAADVRELRSAGRFAVLGTLHDHASRLAAADDPAMRILAQVAGAAETGAIILDDPARSRDWGWTPEYVDAMWRMLQAETPADYVIATGISLTEAEFARHACEWFGVDPALVPEAPSRVTPLADASPIAHDLGWRAYTYGRDFVRTLCEGYAAER